MTSTMITTTPSYHLEQQSQLPEYATDASTPQIPTAIKATYKSSLSKLMCITGKEIHLTPSQTDPTGSQTSYKLSLPRGYYGTMTLEYASSNSTTILARAIPEGRRGYDVLLPGSSVAETLRRESRKNRWWFALPVGPNGEIEKFEWRRSRGSEIKQLGASWRGWKLVRTRSVGGNQFLKPVDSKDADDVSLPGYSSEEEQKSQNGDVAEDGDEVVAVWARTGSWTSLHDVGELAFLNSGARGELGQRWAMMVLMSSLSIWQKAMRDQAMAGATASVSSVTSVAVAT